MARKKRSKGRFARVVIVVILGLSIVGFAYASDVIGKKIFKGVVGQDETIINNSITPATPTETLTIAQTPTPTAVPTPKATIKLVPKPISTGIVYLAHLGKASECDIRGSNAVRDASQVIYDYQLGQVDCIRSKSIDVTNCAAGCQRSYMNFDTTICTASGTNEEVNACLSNISNGWQICTERCKSLVNVCTVAMPQTYKDNFDSLYKQYCQ